MRYRNLFRSHVGHLLTYFNPFNWDILPAAIVLELTNRCNLRCDMCWWDFESPKNKEELTTEQLDLFFSQIVKYKPRITITGAEPLARKDAQDILLLMKRRGIKIFSILTNGTLLTKNHAVAIIESEASMVQISIDGDEATHDNIRGVTGSYEKAVKAIRVLKQTKRELNATFPTIRVNCVISSKNVAVLHSLVDLAESLGVQLQFQHLMWLDEQTINKHVCFLRERFHFSDSSIKNLYNNLQDFDFKLLQSQVEKIKKECRKRDIPLYFLQFSDIESMKMWYSDLTFVPKNRCLEPFMVARISATGELKFCPLIDYSYGNIKDQDFISIWQSKRAKEIRRELRGSGLFPGCVRCCKLG